MKYPCLVDKKHCKTEIHVEIEPSGLDKYGNPYPSVIYDGKCNYQESAKRILTTEKKLIEITGTALFPGDIATSVPNISGGTATVLGAEHRIAQGQKARNPDGTVNYTVLELI